MDFHAWRSQAPQQPCNEARGEIVTAVCIALRPDLRLADMLHFLDTAGLARQKFPERPELASESPKTAGGKVEKMRF